MSPIILNFTKIKPLKFYEKYFLFQIQQAFKKSTGIQSNPAGNVINLSNKYFT